MVTLLTITLNDPVAKYLLLITATLGFTGLQVFIPKETFTRGHKNFTDYVKMIKRLEVQENS